MKAKVKKSELPSGAGTKLEKEMMDSVLFFRDAEFDPGNSKVKQRKAVGIVKYLEIILDQCGLLSKEQVRDIREKAASKHGVDPHKDKMEDGKTDQQSITTRRNCSP